MSVKSYMAKHFGGNYGMLSEEDQQAALSDYYYNYTTLNNQPNRTAGNFTTTTGTTTTGSSTLTQQQLNQMYGQIMTSSTVSSGFSSIWNKWGNKQKKALANIGFEYDKKTNEWILRLTSEVRVPQLEGIMASMGSNGDGKPTDIAILEMKKLKEQLVEKLTAKIILLELIRPRKIDDEE